MKILGHGVDIVSVERVGALIERQGEAFTRRAFTEDEFTYCSSQREPAQFFAARFAAKEAYGKATGLGIGASGDLREVGVKRSPEGRPSLELTGRAQEGFLRMGGKEIQLSLSHDGGFAIASVILIGD
jgi:holo-[acyl-carrier protein] synthase